ncbi:hypothetical protein COCVIDRAFT_43130 [Bipolaris victoriae FI3]|uniref:Uncharacterized protein n=1 Tax=Bipolaris victoriae (strain FI3) TaxID=930091 RepID=W7DR49_BIPV3|nr:hypothetical protein COCVIDRAFT_43130 [Bipolaris victoriae FI3]
MADVAKQHDLLRFVKLEHEITQAEWLRWRWPDTPLVFMTSKEVHTAQWDRDYNLHGKRVLHIGIGSSGVQVIPSVLSKVKELHVVARPLVWITDGFAQNWSVINEGNFTYTHAVKERLRNDQKHCLAYCKAIVSKLNFSIKEMSRKLGYNTRLIENLIPKAFSVGCRRPTPGNGFLKAFTDEKTVVHFGEIPEITANGFKDPKGQEHEVDTIICATGFDTPFMPPFRVLYNGKNLQDNFRGDIKGYLGLTYLPNYFVFPGGYGPLVHGSVLPKVEHYTDYVLQILEKARTDNVKRLSIKRSVSDFTRYADEYLKRTTWSGPCSSWLRNGKTSNKPVLWPGSRIHQLTVLQRPRFEHFDFVYLDGNLCSFLGDGFDIREVDGRDLTWYMGLLDGEDTQPGPFETNMEDGGGKLTGVKNIVC